MSVKNGLVDTVPTEIWLAYEERAAEIAQRAHLEATVAIKNAILRFALEAGLSGSQDPSPSLKEQGTDISADWANALERERFQNSVLFCALFELVDAIENNSGAEPSLSAYDRALHEAKEACCYYAAAPSTPDTLGEKP